MLRSEFVLSETYPSQKQGNVFVSEIKWILSLAAAVRIVKHLVPDCAMQHMTCDYCLRLWLVGCQGGCRPCWELAL